VSEIPQNICPVEIQPNENYSSLSRRKVPVSGPPRFVLEISFKIFVFVASDHLIACAVQNLQLLK
jgi:hypothetical protein